jgi:hypothetical protein
VELKVINSWILPVIITSFLMYRVELKVYS